MKTLARRTTQISASYGYVYGMLENFQMPSRALTGEFSLSQVLLIGDLWQRIYAKLGRK
jgi:hypothetical protein